MCAVSKRYGLGRSRRTVPKEFGGSTAMIAPRLRNREADQPREPRSGVPKPRQESGFQRPGLKPGRLAPLKRETREGRWGRLIRKSIHQPQASFATLPAYPEWNCAF